MGIRVFEPDYLIVDVRDVMMDYAQHKHMYPVYRHFPLSDMIKCILTVDAYGDHGEYFWMELDNRLNQVDSLEIINYDLMSIFYETLTSYLDEYIRSKTPPSVDNGEFVFYRWVNQTTVMLQRDENARHSNSLV